MKNWHFIAFIIIFIGFGIVYYNIANFNPVNNDEVLLKKISELESKIDNLSKTKDSLRIVIDSTHVKIITNEKYYKERVNTIVRQSSSMDSSFVSDYIRQYSNKDLMFDTK